MDAIFAYVLDQFYAVYQPAQPFDISYGVDGRSRIQITRTTSSFFQRTDPWPAHLPVYFSWRETKLPFWFDHSPNDPIISLTEGQAIIRADIIAGAFYFLSGWQEYYSTVRDKYGRFPYHESLQYRHQFITLPVVNYYFDILKTAIERVYSVALQPVLARAAAFTTCLTHDVDNCRTAWRVAGGAALQEGKWSNFWRLLGQKLIGRDHWANVPAVMQTVQQYQATSTFFFLANYYKYQGIANADYDVSQFRYQSWLRLLRQHGFGTEIHGSHITAREPGKLLPEMQKLNGPVRGNRFHYLRFEPKRTPQLLDEASIAYDTTLGFSEHFGFRHGTCFPFRLFNFKTRQPFCFWELPLHLMDATLHHPRYLQLTPAEIMPAITPMLREIQKFGGCFTWLWHNENFSEYNHRNGPAAFHQIMRYLQDQNAAFKTTGQVADLLT